MIASARNQFSGEVAEAKHGAVNDEVTLRLAGDQEIVATVTSESAERLGLTQGKKAVAMVTVRPGDRCLVADRLA